MHPNFVQKKFFGYFTDHRHIGFRRVKVAILTKFSLENTNLLFVN